MPVYNGADTLQAAIESILQQTYTDFELIIVADGSEDNSLSIMQRFEASDSRVRIFRNAVHQGVAVARNDLIAAASDDADFFAFVTCDNISDPQRLAKQVEFLDSHPEISGVGTAISLYHHHDTMLSVLSYPEIADSISSLNLSWQPGILSTFMIRHQLLGEIGGFHPLLSDCDDYDFLLRAIEHSTIANLPESLVSFHDKNPAYYAQLLKHTLKIMLHIQRKYIFSRRYFTLSRFFCLLGRHLILLLPSRLVLNYFYTHRAKTTRIAK